jgi:signal recognition particle subunit SRP54
MTGQDAVNSAKAFNDALELDGVILTKLDGDTRGGAALSIKAVTGVPIKYIGVGEQLNQLEEFHPDRMAGRILGAGDMATLVEKAQQEFDAADMEEQQQKMLEGKFSLDDFQKQMRQIKKIGSMKSIMKMIPGMGRMADMDPDMDPEADLRRIDGMINSMTPDEKQNPGKIDRSRRNRIAHGSGTDPSEINRLLKDFRAMGDMMQKLAGMGKLDQFKAFKELSEGGMLDPGARLQKEKQRSKRGPMDASKAKFDKKKKRKQARKQRRKNRR